MADAIVGDDKKGRATLFVEETLRRTSTKVTHEIALRRGRGLGMWVGCGYPKSGTVWLCTLMGSALGIPFPRDSQMPVMMPAVVHGHWMYDERLPPTLYIRRDGRDQMVSHYFFWTRALQMSKSPRFRRGLQKIFDELYGPRFDPEDVRGNMPRFVEYQMTVAPTTHGVTWHQHVQDWWDRPNVGHVTYEELLSDPAPALQRAIGDACGQPPDLEVAELAARRHAFARDAGRQPGEENRGSFLRKGVSGDWPNYFTSEAGEVFDSFAGTELVKFGYAEDRDWYRSL